MSFMQKSIQKMVAVADNRKACLQASRERIKEKSEHAEQIGIAKRAARFRQLTMAMIRVDCTDWRCAH